jgi:caffeoyl-CoA O-methyltransferase
LARLVGAQNILEIGAFMGYSTLWMASALPANGTIISLEFRDEHAALARAHAASSPHAAQVTIHEGDALHWLGAQAVTPRFDMLFIDAEKRAYPEYLQAALPLLTPHALVVADNSLLWGALSGDAPDAASKEAKTGMQRFNDMLADPALFDGILLPTPEGLTVGRRKP